MDYNALRKMVSQCVYGKLDNLEFGINMHNLRDKVKEMGLVPVRYKRDVKSKMVEVDDIFVLSEYFKGKNRLEWFDKNKSYCNILFVQIKDIDDRMKEILAGLVDEDVKKESDVDKVALLAELISTYPCISTLVAKTVKEDDTIGINIRFRSNPIMIDEIQYQYRHEDM